MNNDKWICPFSYFPKVGFIFKKTLKEVHKSKILCHMCEYRDSSFMPCNACDDLGSQFKKSGGSDADNKEIDYLEPNYEITDLGIIHYLVPHYKEDDIKYDIEPTYLDDKIPYKAESEG